MKKKCIKKEEIAFLHNIYYELIVNVQFLLLRKHLYNKNTAKISDVMEKKKKNN